MAAPGQTAAALPRERALDAADLRRLQIMAARLVTGAFAGEYRSVFRGRGIEFETVREYQPGDDVRCIDWNVTARAGRPYLKQYVEERELTVMLLLDCSASLDCPTPRGPKSRVASEACALLAFAAARNNDRVGLLTYSDRVEAFIPPAKGSRQAQRVVAAALARQPSERGTDLAGALEHLNRVSRHGATICLVSDFQAADFRRELACLARRHDVVAAQVTDPTDRELPEAGLLQVRDPETGCRRLVDCSDTGVRHAYRLQAATRSDELLHAFRAVGVSSLELSTTVAPLESLTRFFQGRQRQGRGAR